MEAATMRVLADTSVLVAGMVESHPAHERAFPWLVRAYERQVELLVCSHSLAELYAVLTTLPVRPRIRPDTARRMIRDNVESVATIVELCADDYRETMDRLSELGLSGGVIYDALAARAARKANADRLLTLNESDFRRVWPDGGECITAP
jgi:predicted nucleic acid-binding protein